MQHPNNSLPPNPMCISVLLVVLCAHINTAGHYTGYGFLFGLAHALPSLYLPSLSRKTWNNAREESDDMRWGVRNPHSTQHVEIFFFFFFLWTFLKSCNNNNNYNYYYYCHNYYCCLCQKLDIEHILDVSNFNAFPFLFNLQYFSSHFWVKWD